MEYRRGGKTDVMFSAVCLGGHWKRVNAMVPGSYFRPHRHTDPARWELFAALAGSAAVLTLSREGVVLQRTTLGPAGAALAVEEGCEGAVEVYNLAADMGGMGFIENNKALCMLSVLISTHMLIAAREAGVERYFYSSSACVYAAEKQTVTDVTALKEAEEEAADLESAEKLLQALGFSGSTLPVDIQAVGFGTGQDDFRTQLGEHMGCNMVGGAVGAVEDEGHSSHRVVEGFGEVPDVSFHRVGHH